MFWQTDKQHNLPHNPFKSCIVPRPIAWISTISQAGIANLAPYSYFNGVATDPPMVMFSTDGLPENRGKDTLNNILQTREFVVNMVSSDLQNAMNITSTSVAPDVDEFELAGLDKSASRLVKPPGVKQSPIQMECVYFDKLELPVTSSGLRNVLVTGKVVGIHIKDEFLNDGIIDIERITPLARMGYQDYTKIDQVFKIVRPK
ncbi:MAG: flavin reductase family protein [Gammaproteobacteria bacterium]|nr:flavin reductase family protein [Gammaproteobacteria bacterium]MDH5631255.1 flavin reductase family protein [Gammaproteobacteria bacterium]